MCLRKVCWPLGLSLLALTVALLIFADVWSDLDDRIVFYYSRETALLLACLVIPLCLAVIVSRIDRRPPRDRIIALFLSVVILLGANVVACAALPALITRYQNFSSLYVGSRLYRLDSTISGTLADLGDILLLWECDASGLFCRVIYAKDFYSDMVPKLTSDPTKTTLFLVINDKVSFAYHP